MKVNIGKIEKAPTKEEVAAHVVNHIPVRFWRAHCVKEKATGNPHRRRKAMDEGSRELVVSIDYIFMHDNQGMPIMVIKDRRTRITTARIVPQKGNRWYGIKVLTGVIESLGHSKIILKSDQEPALISFKDAVKSEARVGDGGIAGVSVEEQ